MNTAHSTYPAELQSIFAHPREINSMPLAGSLPVPADLTRLIHTLGAAQLFPNAPHPQAALSGLWLYFSHLDESHSISQSLHTPEGSFWHAIMHRREPDPSNAAYWFRRLGRHPIFPSLCAEAGRVLARHPESSFPLGKQWDPFAFIDFCEQARLRPGSPHENLALDIQRAEWQILFDFCAGGRPLCP